MSNFKVFKDTTIPLWEYYYAVKLHILHSRDEEDIRTFGVPITGFKEIDDTLQNTWYQTMLTPVHMAIRYGKGQQIRVVKYADCEEIYHHIANHLLAWRQHIEYGGLNVGLYPIDDLILLDRLANAIYDHAKWLFTEEIIESFIHKDARSRATLDPSKIIKPIKDITKTQFYNCKQEPPERQALEPLIHERFVQYKSLNKSTNPSIFKREVN